MVFFFIIQSWLHFEKKHRILGSIKELIYLQLIIYFITQTGKTLQFQTDTTSLRNKL